MRHARRSSPARWTCALLASLPGAALAAPDAPLPLCHPQRAVPRCAAVPDGLPPRIGPAEADALGARFEREHEAESRAAIEREADGRIEADRAAAWRSRVEATRPPTIDVRTPLVDTSAGFRFGALAELGGHAGPELGLGFRLDHHFGAVLSTGLLQTWAGSRGSWGAVSIAPAFVVSLTDRGATLFARVGPDLLVLVGAPGHVPPAFLGAHVGGGVLAPFVQLPNYGFVGWELELRGALRAGVGGPASSLDVVRGGLDLATSVKVAF